MPQQNKFFTWQESKPGLIFITVFDLLFAYIFVSFAIDTGSLVNYFLAAAFFALGVGHGVKLFKKVTRKNG